MVSVLLSSLLTMLGLLSPAPMQQSPEDKVLGIYWTPSKEAKMEISKEGNIYVGKLVWGKTGRTDTKNPNPDERQKSLLGKKILTGFVYKEGKYVNGQIYDPNNGKTYQSTMWLEGKHLKVRGYIGISLLGRTETFEPVAQ